MNNHTITTDEGITYTKGQFTPGPWEPRGYGGPDTDGIELIILARPIGRELLATVAEVDPGRKFDKYYERRANAVLIAAAPNLLAALETLMDCEQFLDTYTDEFDAARAAITLARSVR